MNNTTHLINKINENINIDNTKELIYHYISQKNLFKDSPNTT